MPSVEHVQHKYQNNRAENSHQPTRVREKVMRRFKSAGHAQRFLSPFGIIYFTLPSRKTPVQRSQLSRSIEAEIRWLGRGDSQLSQLLVRFETSNQRHGEKRFVLSLFERLAAS